MFMGNLSTNPLKDWPAFAPKSAAHLFYTITLKSSLADNHPFIAGKEFKGAKFGFLQLALNLKKTKEYIILAVPNSFPFGKGLSGVPAGDIISDDIDSFFAAAHPAGPSWLGLITDHVTDMGEVILTNLGLLTTVLPAIPPDAKVESDPFLSWTALTHEDQETTHFDLCVGHTAKLAAFNAPHPPAFDINLGNVIQGGGGGWC